MKISYIIIILFAIGIIYFYFNDVKVASSLDDVIIISPRDLEEVSGIINVKGTSNYEEVYYKIDLEEWKKIEGKNWKFSLDADKLSKGQHTIYVKANEQIKAAKIIVL